MTTGDLDRIAYFLLKDVKRAIGEFDLIAGGDRIAVAVSGGKDSRAMLELLLRHRRKAPYHYDLLALHVVGVAIGLPDLRSELVPYFEDLGVDYRSVPLELPPEEKLPLECFRCSWIRRKALFTHTVELGCNKLALGHHADDAAATTLMSLMFNGQIETMAPHVSFFDDAVTLIRPLIYLPRKDLVRYARAVGYPEDPVCPQGLTSKREQIQDLLQQFGRDQGQIRANLWRVARQAMGF